MAKYKSTQKTHSSRTHKRHASKWSSATKAVSQAWGQYEDPEHYFRDKAIYFGTWNFLDKSRGGIGLKRGKNQGIDLQGFYMSVAWDLMFEATRWCEQAQRYMFNNHKWQNRTGDAEMSVDAKVSGVHSNALVMTLYHGVYYGVYLERSHEPGHAFPKAGDVSVIPDTLQIYAPKLAQSLQHIIDSR